MSTPQVDSRQEGGKMPELGAEKGGSLGLERGEWVTPVLEERERQQEQKKGFLGEERGPWLQGEGHGMG